MEIVFQGPVKAGTLEEGPATRSFYLEGPQLLLRYGDEKVRKQGGSRNTLNYLFSYPHPLVFPPLPSIGQTHLEGIKWGKGQRV